MDDDFDEDDDKAMRVINMSPELQELFDKNPEFVLAQVKECLGWTGREFRKRVSANVLLQEAMEKAGASETDTVGEVLTKADGDRISVKIRQTDN